MDQAIVFALVDGQYHVAVIKEPERLRSKYISTRETAAFPLMGYRYSGPKFRFYAQAIAHARELQEQKGNVPIYEIQWKNGVIRAIELD